MTAPTRPSLSPARALTHPLWLAALALLVLNDHVLKGSGLLPGVLTGKLSDLAGLFLAPALLATLVRARRPRAVLGAHLAVGLVFAAIKASAAAAHALEAAMALTPFPWHVTVDPTDLLALPMLWASWRLVKHLSHTPTAARRVAVVTFARRAATTAAAGLGVVSALATSPPPEDMPPTVSPTVFTELVVGSSAGTLILRVRPLRDTVWVDCAELMRSPSTALDEELFGPAIVWMIDAGRAVQLAGDGMNRPLAACDAVLVDGTLHLDFGGTAAGLPVPRALVAWTASQFPATALSTDVAAVLPGRLLAVGVTADGRAAWASHPALFPAPFAPAEPPAPECQAAPEGGLVDWETPLPSGERTLTALTTEPDGCARLELREGEGGIARPWYVCAAGVTIPFAPGDRVNISAALTGQDYQPVDGVKVLGLGDAAGSRLVIARGGDLAPYGEGHWTARDRAGCGAVRGPCGALVVPQDVEATGVSGGTLTIVRAERVPIGDGACTPEASGEAALVLESVYVEPPIAEATELTTPADPE